MLSDSAFPTAYLVPVLNFQISPVIELLVRMLPRAMHPLTHRRKGAQKRSPQCVEKPAAGRRCSRT